jgi:hypothetical protein
MAPCRFCGTKAPLTAARLAIRRSCLRFDSTGSPSHRQRAPETARLVYALALSPHVVECTPRSDTEHKTPHGTP